MPFTTYPLLLATLLEQLDIVQLLLLWGADANQVLPNGLSAVHAAAFHARDADALAAASLNDSKVVTRTTDIENGPEYGQLFRLFCDPVVRRSDDHRRAGQQDPAAAGGQENSENKQQQNKQQHHHRRRSSDAGGVSSSGYAEDAQPRFVEDRWSSKPLKVCVCVGMDGARLLEVSCARRKYLIVPSLTMLLLHSVVRGWPAFLLISSSCGAAQIGGRVFVHGRSSSGVSPLHVAAYHGRHEVLQLLLRASGVGVAHNANDTSRSSSNAPSSAGGGGGGDGSRGGGGDAGEAAASKNSTLALAQQHVATLRGGCCELDVSRFTVDGYSALRMALFSRSSRSVQVCRQGAIMQRGRMLQPHACQSSVSCLTAWLPATATAWRCV